MKVDVIVCLAHFSRRCRESAPRARGHVDPLALNGGRPFKPRVKIANYALGEVALAWGYTNRSDCEMTTRPAFTVWRDEVPSEIAAFIDENRAGHDGTKEKAPYSGAKLIKILYGWPLEPTRLQHVYDTR